MCIVVVRNLFYFFNKISPKTQRGTHENKSLVIFSDKLKIKNVIQNKLLYENKKKNIIAMEKLWKNQLSISLNFITFPFFIMLYVYDM